MIFLEHIFYLFHLFILIFRIYCYIAISLLPFVFYYSFFETSYKPNSDYYHKKEWYHLLKVFWAKRAVNKYKKSFKDAIKNESDESLEQPRKDIIFMRSDNEVIYGVDQSGNSLYLRITLRGKRLAESCLQIRLANGQVFQLPDHPKILVCSIPERKWQSGGLEITVIEPFAILNIKYNGFLRNAIRNNEKEDTGEVKHCQFNFTWTAATEPKFFPQEVSTHELAEAVSVEPWKNPKWINLLGYHTGYDQYGSLSGYFTHYSRSNLSPGTSFVPTPVGTPVLPTSPYTTTHLRLASSRKRAWGPAEARSLHRMLTLFGKDKHGFMFNVGVRSYSRGCKELPIGSAMLPNRKILFVEDCDISLPDFVENGIIPGAFSFSFKGGRKLYSCTAFTHKSTVADMKNDELMGYNGKLVKTEYLINGEEACGYAVFWYRFQGKGVNHPPYIIRPGIQTIEPERKYIAPLKSPECRSVYLAGIKGTSLALLTAIPTDKFDTVDGFCILAPALEKYLENYPTIKAELSKLNDICFESREENLQEICESIQNLFIYNPLTSELQDMILQELSYLKFTDTANTTKQLVRYCWTVRGANIHGLSRHEYSGGGGYLDCFSDEEVILAVKKCWANAYKLTKVLERRKYGLPIICKMGVIVQYTINAEISGELTTINPETGDPAEMIVTAKYGLGVGSTIKDSTIISRSWNNKLAVSTIIAATKPNKIIIGDRGLIEVENNNKEEVCISKNQILQLGQAGLVLEQALGNAQSLEWAFSKDRLYILNISPLHPQFLFPNTFELSDSAILNANDAVIHYTTDNLFTGNTPCCDLTRSMGVKYLDQVLQKVHEGKISTKGGYKKLALWRDIVGSNIYETLLKYVDKEITDETKINELITTGKTFVKKDLHQEALIRNNISNLTSIIPNLYRTVKYCWSSEDNTEKATLLSQGITLSSQNSSSSLEILKIIKRNLHLLKQIIYFHITVNQTYIFYQKLYFNLFYENSSAISPTDFQAFLAHYSNSEIYTIPNLIDILAGTLWSRNLGDEFIMLQPQDAVQWLEKQAPDLAELMEKIMNIIRFRGVNEFDFTSEPWENNTFTIIKIIQMIIKKMNNKEHKYEPKMLTRTENPYKEQSKLKSKFLQWLNHRLQHSFSRREKTLEAVAITINKFRWAFRDLAQKLILEGKLPTPELICYLTIREVELVASEKRVDLIKKAANRITLRTTPVETPIEFYTGYMIMCSEQLTLKNHQNQNQNEHAKQRIIGKIIIQGHVVGRVCVLDNIRQVELIQPGDILVTKSLDIGWSPYFGIISGLICETGSVISQGAIAVYKQNIPCIIGAHNATKILNTGDTIVMTGDIGFIEKISSTS